MSVLSRPLRLIFLAVALCLPGAVRAQENPPPAAPVPAAELPPVPQGVEVLARGPIHEAYATPTVDPVPTTPVPKAPPRPLDEMPPEQKPAGNAIWINGYWAWDDDRKDYLWVSGVWRSEPPGKRWVAGYWREEGSQWQWVPGFWAAAEPQQAHQQVTYLPAPPPPPEIAPPGRPPTVESFYVPGTWVWVDGRYVWRAGYWATVQPGYVWVPSHYRWTPGGYVYIPGYWDMAMERRGVLFAPVIVHAGVVPATFVYTPAYVVHDTVVVDTLFVRPGYCHYYFGDYYGPRYREIGFVSGAVYSREHYDAIYVYARWEHRDEPRWETAQLDITLARHAGKAPLPPRTLVQQNTIIQQNITNVNVVNNTTNVYQKNVVNQTTVLAPVSQMAAVKKTNTVILDPAARSQVRQQAQAVQQVARQRVQSEQPAPPGTPVRPRVATLSVPPVPATVSRPAAAASRTPAASIANPPAPRAGGPVSPGPNGAHAPGMPPGPPSRNGTNSPFVRPPNAPTRQPPPKPNSPDNQRKPPPKPNSPDNPPPKPAPMGM